MPETEHLRRIVIKLGTQLLVGEAAESRLRAIVAEAAKLRAGGTQIVFVSSGAVGLGRTLLGLDSGSLEDKQACAAVGQSRLMALYEKLFATHSSPVAQVLLTAHDFSDRERYLNLRNTFERLLELSVVPIVNENDVVSTAGIAEDSASRSFDDNDRLSALVAAKLDAEALIILTNVDGVFDADPGAVADAKLIRTIQSFADLETIRTDGQSEHGRGGMTTKLAAGRIAALCGVKTVISSGFIPKPIENALTGAVGTTIMPQGALPGRKRWIGLSSGFQGVVVVNDCAEEVLLKGGTSLLPVGVVDVQGDFEPPAVVSVQNERGVEIGRGLVSMSAETARCARGKQSAEISLRAGEKAELIHRDNLVMFGV